MRAITFGVGAVLVLALPGAGCDWRTFDDLKKTTPVVSLGAPSDYPASDDFGPILLPLAPPTDGSGAGRFVATATHRTSIAVISFDAAGQPSGVGVTGPALDLLQQGPITAIAAVPGGEQIVLGAPATTLGDVLLMRQASPYGTMKFLDTVGEPQYGVGVGAGNLGGTSMPEIIVLSARTLHVYLDSLPTIDKQYVSLGASDPCPIDFSAALPEADRVNRPVIVASVLASGTQIVVGTPAPSGVGHVSVFDFDATTGVISCAAALTGTEAHFGRAMTLVDLVPDANHAPDHLLVGAPPTRVYLYSLPLTTGAAPVAMVPDMMGGGALFGAAVAAFDVDGVAGDEVLVGNADATVGAVTTAGRVSIYTGVTLTPLPVAFPNPLAEHDPGAGHGYGSAAAGMAFCPGNAPSTSPDAAAPAGDGGVASCTTLPLVGSLSKVFAYFTLKTPDPRVK